MALSHFFLIVLLLPCAFNLKALGDGRNKDSVAPVETISAESDPKILYSQPRLRVGRFLSSKEEHLTADVKSSLSLSVSGFVRCQHCKQVGTNSLLQSTRLPDAKVRLACRDKLQKTFVYRTTYTNSHGYFNFLVEDYDFRLHGGVKNCIVYLVSSSSQQCYKTTNINSGRIGAPLTQQKVYPDVISYSVGPFSFAPPSCRLSDSSYFKLSKPWYRTVPSVSE
ncbi:hypothetical protein KP509_24G030400 [Ceratopteris richardii]|uniref:Uncharacterized protein n=1 Tax=Ceratopteris richardii TaxID=49495 RepID=A0A8T2RV71_CERRI|nr:hypothetical protein KP509_24G030400 [Ceratopteris richardii]